jgi:hypothetical protein
LARKEACVKLGPRKLRLLKRLMPLKRSQRQVWWLIPVILLTWEAEMGRITVRGQPEQKVHAISSKSIKAGRGAHACHPSYIGRVNRRIKVQAHPSINARPYSKNI